MAEDHKTAEETADNRKEEKKLDITEHLKTLDEISQQYSVQFTPEKPTDSQGLSKDEVSKRLEKYGLNQLTPPKKWHPIIVYFYYVSGIFNVMLIVAGAISYVLYGIDTVNNRSLSWIGGILIGVALLNAFIEFYQIQKSQAILESFMNLIPSKCYVVREKHLTQIDAIELTMGDVIYVRSGDKVPADCMMFKTTDLKVDNSSLTGEAEPQERFASNSHQNPLEASNLIFNGTLVVNGEGYGIVIRVGDNTVIGQIASMTANEQKRESPMSREITHFVHIIASIAAVVALTFMFVSKFALNQSWSSAINFAIGTFVSFVPEGLPATVTMLLSFAAKRMASQNVLVKDLQGVETLGAITLLATDKTGTLTRNQMTVTYIWTGLSLYYAQTQSSTEAQVAKPVDVKNPGVSEILHMSCLCSRARFESNEGPISDRPILGDATEAGLLRCAAVKLENFSKAAETYPKVFEIPFNSDNKWAMTIHKKQHENGSLMLYLKGAPERVLRLCTTIYDGQKPVPLTDSHKAEFNSTYEFMASKGHRVLAFAALALPGDKFPSDFEFTKNPINYPTGELTFYGLVSLEDPPKHGVREAIGHCREAGIKVMMVTGDHPLTAEAIGRKINLMLQDTKEKVAKKRNVPISQVPECDVNSIVIHGETIDSLTDADWDNIFSKDEIIFARTSPKHKLQIVKHAQSLGHIVGVTGDGVNDSPALKKADLGIAMNQSGSDVSKEAAAMILIDDNFASTVNGITEGRLIFQNLKKSIQYTITHTMPEVYANLLSILVPIPLPLSNILILVVDLGFELIVSLSYCWDPPESKTGLMKLQPRKPVTSESIARRKRDEAEAASGKYTQVFTREFWARKFENSDEEVLVDRQVLSWSYLEAGSIITIGSLIAYFYAIYRVDNRFTPSYIVQNYSSFPTTSYIPSTPSDPTEPSLEAKAVAAGQSAYYIGIFLQQAFNMFICKARLGFPWGKFMFANKMSFVMLFIAAAFSFVIVYGGWPFNIAFGTYYELSPIVWLIPLASGVFLWIYSIIRTYIYRMLYPIKYSEDIYGLQMHPTRWSTGGAK